MKTETREIYRCDFCKKIYLRKHACINHEKQCFRNPENKRDCLNGCEYLVKKDSKVYTGIDNYETGEPIYVMKSLFYCEKKKTFLYTPKSEHKGNYFTDFYNEEIENNPMPKKCKFYNEFKFLF